MTIIHFVSRAQLHKLFEVVAMPTDQHGQMDWIAPRWWYVMLETAAR